MGAYYVEPMFRNWIDTILHEMHHLNDISSALKPSQLLNNNYVNEWNSGLDSVVFRRSANKCDKLLSR